MKYLVPLLVAAGILCLSAVSSAQETTRDGTTPAGARSAPFDPQECRACHEEVFPLFDRTTHASVNQSCAQCHGNAAEHLATGDPSHVTSFKTLKPQQINATCLACHDRRRQANWHGGKHDRRNVACTNCHSVHHFKSQNAQLRTEREVDTCFSCHQNVRSQSMRASHHPVREGKMGCASCHDPHDGSQPKMLKAASVNELCYSCHTEKRGPFMWEHAPARENCAHCHTPHGSNHEKLLVAKSPYLCQRCHLNTRHPGSLYHLPNVTATGPTASNRAIEHACRNCHQNIHGSNSPSGPWYSR